MKKRYLLPLLSLALLPASCSSLVSVSRPYVPTDTWPMNVPLPASEQPLANAPSLTVQSITPNANTTIQGFQVLKPDGTVETSFYQRWAAPPFEAALQPLILSLQNSGIFSAVTTPANLIQTDYILQPSLNNLYIDETTHQAVASATFILLNGKNNRIIFQKRFTGFAPLNGFGAQDMQSAMENALGRVFAQLTEALSKTVT